MRPVMIPVILPIVILVVIRLYDSATFIAPEKVLL